MSASIYYKALFKDRKPNPPEIIFRNVHCYKEHSHVEYTDYALFRFNIIVQTNQNNYDPNSDITGFSVSCCGNMQVYPTTFTTDMQSLTLNNRINDDDSFTIEDDRFKNGRMIYCTDTILDNAVANIEEKLTVECIKHCGNAILKFNFKAFDESDNYDCQDNLLIYSINVELLNNGKIPLHLISTNNFTVDIN